MISDEDINRVSSATDFVSLVSETTQVKQKGRDYWCCCPFHQEKTPSCKIDPANNTWHCFGCGEGGSVFNYVMKLNGVSFREAVHILADRAHIEIEDSSNFGVSQSEKKTIVNCCKEACVFFETQLLRGKGQRCDNARAYLASRNFGIDVAKRWNLGYAPGNGTLFEHLSSLGFSPEEIEKANLATRHGSTWRDRFFNRVMFPIFDTRGDCIAFGGRVIGKGEPKYLNSSETIVFHKSNVLFGLDKAKNYIVSTGYAAVVEGYTDVIACHEAGIKNVVATLGTSLTLQHIKLLSRYASKKIVYLFDGDEAGQRAAERALQFIDYRMTPEAGQSRCDLHAATIPNAMDPAEYIEAKGAEAMRDVLENSVPLIDFGIRRRIAKYDLSTPEGRSRALMDAISILAPIKDSILAKDYASMIASLTRASESDALAQLMKLNPPKAINFNSYSVNPIENHAEVKQYAAAAATDEIELTVAEKNRRLNESELVSLSVQYPVIAITFADDLLGIDWHVPLHKMIIEKTLSYLMDDLTTTSTVIINRLLQEIPKSQTVVTSASAESEKDAEEKYKLVLTNVKLDDFDAQQESLSIELATAFDNVKRAEILHKIADIAEKKAKLTATK